MKSLDCDGSTKTHALVIYVIVLYSETPLTLVTKASIAFNQMRQHSSNN